MLIDHTLKATGGNKSRAAQILGVSRKYLYDKLRARGRSA
jgi:DNA-binding NtrC family response regulator